MDAMTVDQILESMDAEAGVLRAHGATARSQELGLGLAVAGDWAVKARDREQHLYLWVGPEVSLADAYLARRRTAD